MSLQPQAIYLVPEETARVARAAFRRRSSPWMQMRDQLGSIFDDQDFAALYPNVGHAAASPHRLALALIMQAAENLTDQQAATAISGRMDWKYALSMELADPGVDASVLSEFRTRLLTGSAERLIFDTLLSLLQDQELLTAGGLQRTDSTHVLAAVHTLNRLELIGETLRAALNALATVAPEWLQAWVPADWFDRYSDRCEDYRLPEREPARQALTTLISADGYGLLERVSAPDAPPYLRHVPAVEVLRRVWVQQLYGPETPGRWRTSEDSPPRLLAITSPYDTEARAGTKRDLTWVGYKVHVTESCDPDRPHLLTDVTTTPAPLLDHQVTLPIQTTLVEQGLAPATHLVDTGYVDAANLVASASAHGIVTCGPVPPDTSWQTRAAEGYSGAQFRIDWAKQQARCPQGQVSGGWQEKADRHGAPTVQIRFAAQTCAACPVRAQCTRSMSGGRMLQVRPEAEHGALQTARQRQETPEFWATYAGRAGVEGTLSQGVRVCGLRMTRYIGEARTHLYHLLMATAINVLRVVAWLGKRPQARTRQSRFAALRGAPLGRLAPI